VWLTLCMGWGVCRVPARAYLYASVRLGERDWRLGCSCGSLYVLGLCDCGSVYSTACLHECLPILECGCEFVRLQAGPGDQVSLIICMYRWYLGISWSTPESP
jgi:hypothetical protein